MESSEESRIDVSARWRTLAPELDAFVARLGGLAERAIEAAFVRTGETVARIERYLARVAEEPDARRRRELLEEVACVFERELGDPDRALTALLEAYRETPAKDAWWELERLAGLTGRFAELASEIEATLPHLPAGDRADAWTRLGSLRAERLGAADDALAAFAAALGSDPDHREATERRLRLLRDLERWLELAEALAVLAQRESPAAAARRHLERAAAYERLGDVLAASDAYRDALAADASCDDARRALEAALRRRGESAELVRFLGERLERAGEDEQQPLRRELAALCLRTGDRAGAILHYEELRAATPGDLDTLRALDRLYDEDSRVRDQLDVLTAQVGQVADVGERATLYRRMAALWIERLGATGEAEECLEWLVAYDAADDDNFHTLARSYRASGRLRPAMDVMTRHAAATRSPAVRAELYLQLAEIQERELHDDTRAMEFWEKAERDLADPRPARRALARLCARNETLDSDRAGAMLERAIASGVSDARTLLALARIRRLERRHPAATELAKQAIDRAVDAGERAAALSELGRVHEDADDAAAAIQSYLVAVELDPEQHDARERAADLLWSERRHAELLPLLERLAHDATHALVRQSRLVRLARAGNAASLTVRHAHSAAALADLAIDSDLSFEDGIEVQCQLGLIALAAGRAECARTHLEAASALDPYHRPAHLALVALDGFAPGALAHLDGVELLPTDHKVLHSLLDACEAEKAWDAALAVLGRLIEVEASPATRGRYRHAAGAICRETLGREADAFRHFEAALADDPDLERATLAIEEILRARADLPGLLAFHMGCLGHLGAESNDGRNPERLRLWSSVAELCLDHLGDRASGITALEVAVELGGEPDANAAITARRARLAALCLETGPDGHERAIAAHHKLLRVDKGRADAYVVLERLYRETWRFERAAACACAAAALTGAPVPPEKPVPLERSLDAELWGRLRHPDEDRLLDLLFASVTPALAAAQARARRPAPFRKGAIPPTDSRACARAMARVVAAFGLPLPSSYPRPDLATPVTFRPRVIGDHLVAEVLLGAPLLEASSDADAAVDIALAFAHLRPERFARVLVTDADSLARVIEAAIALAAGEAVGPGLSATLDLLRQTLSAVALDQVATIGHRLRERGVAAAAAARGWLAATELTAARAALLVADLPTCVRRLEAAGADRARVVDVIWSSTTDELAEVRQQLAVAPIVLAPPAPGRHARSAGK